jgi:hypothetical protein
VQISQADCVVTMQSGRLWFPGVQAPSIGFAAAVAGQLLEFAASRAEIAPIDIAVAVDVTTVHALAATIQTSAVGDDGHVEEVLMTRLLLTSALQGHPTSACDPPNTGNASAHSSFVQTLSCIRFPPEFRK